MDALYVLIPLSLLFAGSALFCFIWAARRGQFADLSSPAERILMDDIDE